jgi:hypothetical protein
MGARAVAASGEDLRTSSSGWDTRLYWLWILYNTVAFVVLLTAVAVMAWLGANVLDLSVANRHWFEALLVATVGALLFGVVLGALQWLVIRQRVSVPRKQWIVANVGPAFVGWLLVIMPAVIQAENSHQNVGTAYLLAVSQTLALGPLLGLSQSLVLRKYTRRWVWWIGANLISYLVVAGVAALLPNHFNPLNLSHSDGSIAQVYLMLIATTPLTGRALLWVLAPSARIDQQAAVAT